MSLAEQLYVLQKLDQETESARRRLTDVTNAFADTRAVDHASERLTAASALATQRSVRQTDLELEVQGLADKLARETERLYGGSVRNPKELEGIQEEISSLQRRQAKLEDDLLQAMIESEEATTSLAIARERLAAETVATGERRAVLAAEELDLRRRIADLAAQRTAVAEGIGAADLASYESLRKRKGGLAVAGVVGDACAACGVAVSANRRWHLREGNLVHCANCDRIIVLL